MMRLPAADLFIQMPLFFKVYSEAANCYQPFGLIFCLSEKL